MAQLGSLSRRNQACVRKILGRTVNRASTPQARSRLLVRALPIGLDARQAAAAESLGSWLFRLACANGFASYGDMLNNYSLRAPMRAQLDIGSDRWGLIDGLESLTFVGIDSIEKTTLCTLLVEMTGAKEGVLGRWILRESVVSKSRGMRYAVCPACLISDDVPYLRVHWRLSTATWCARHSCMLVDRCDGCGEPFVLTGRYRGPIGVCCGCKQPVAPAIRSARKRGSSLCAAPGDISSSQLSISLACPHQLWDGVRVLLFVMTSPKNVDRLTRAAIPSAMMLAVREAASQTRQMRIRKRAPTSRWGRSPQDTV